MEEYLLSEKKFRRIIILKFFCEDSNNAPLHLQNKKLLPGEINFTHLPHHHKYGWMMTGSKTHFRRDDYFMLHIQNGFMEIGTDSTEIINYHRLET